MESTHAPSYLARRASRAPATPNERPPGHDHESETTTTGVIAGIAIILVCILGIMLWAEQEPPPRVALVSQDTVHVEGFGAYAVADLPGTDVFTDTERLHVMQQAASHLRSYRLGFQDARGARPSDTDLLWLARIAYTEARADGLHAMLLVSAVAVNRMRSQRYPDSMREVALDPRQFSAFNDRSETASWRQVHSDTQLTAWRNAQRAAFLALTLPKTLQPFGPTVYHFYSPVSMEPKYHVPPWAEPAEPIYQIGDRFKFYADIS